MPISSRHYELIREWNEAKEQLKVLSEKESQLRDTLVEELFNGSKKEGSETIDIGDEWKLKATKKFNYTLNNNDNQVAIVCAALPDVVSRSLVRWKPDLVLAAWRKMDAHTQEMFKDVLEIKPGKPALEVIMPKVE